jgi:RimJ/RimL family protein N-acetyltransferase
VADARIPMLGIVPEFRGHPASALAMGALLAEALDLAARRGWARVEISWILEENAAMRNAMERLGAGETGRWRLWRGAAG